MIDYLIDVVGMMAEEIAYGDMHQYQIFDRNNIFYVTYPCQDKNVCQDTFDMTPEKISYTIKAGEKAANKFLDNLSENLNKKIARRKNDISLDHHQVVVVLRQ